MQRRDFIKTGLSATMLTATSRWAWAQDTFHGFDPGNVGAVSPSAESLRAMVAEAVKVTPPRNGKRYVFGYTMWGGSSPFSQLNRKGIEALTAQAGIDLITADNEWDPQRNVANAQTFAIRNVDYVINSLLDIQFAGAVRAPLDAAGIPLIALDIPVPGSKWTGVNNARAGFLAGTYLAQTALNRWGDFARQAHLVIAAFPLVGPNGLLRNLSQEMGARAVIDFPDSKVTWLDMQGTAESGFAQMNTLLNRLDPDKPILIATFSDEQLAGALRAIQVAGRSDMTMAVGMGGERLDVVSSDPSLIGTLSFFPEYYAYAAIPAALMQLAGKTTPDSIFTYSALVTGKNVCKVDPANPCRQIADWQTEDASIDEAKYKSYVVSLHQHPSFADYKMLLPAIPT